MNPPRRLVPLLAAALALAACGGAEAVDEPDVTVTAPAPDSCESPSETPTPSIPADAPSELLAGIGPIEVLGDALAPFPQSGADPAVGRCAPVLVGEDFSGAAVRVDPAADGATWVIFLAHWCPHCNDEIPVINGLRDVGDIPDGIDVVGVSTAASPDRPNFPPGEWLADKDWTFGVLADGVDTERELYVAATAYGVSGFPFSVLVGADGKVIERWSGERTADELVAKLGNGLLSG